MFIKNEVSKFKGREYIVTQTKVIALLQEMNNFKFMASKYKGPLTVTYPVLSGNSLSFDWQATVLKD